MRDATFYVDFFPHEGIWLKRADELFGERGNNNGDDDDDDDGDDDDNDDDNDDTMTM